LIIQEDVLLLGRKFIIAMMNTLEMKGVVLAKIAQIAEIDDPNVLMEVIDFLDSMLVMPNTDSG